INELRPHYHPPGFVERDPDFARVMQLLDAGHFNQFEPGLFDSLIESILSPGDPWMVAADFSSYVAAQQRAADAYRDRARWIRSSIMNSACSGKFSTDRTMQEYNEGIWGLTPVTPLNGD
ncbi:MAG: hypothetical protein B0D88_07865, partial [Candidatus Sedimenticola endophacoides]